MVGWRAAYRRLVEHLSETQRVRPAGALGVLVAALSVLSVVIISWFALYATVTQQLPGPLLPPSAAADLFPDGRPRTPASRD